MLKASKHEAFSKIRSPHRAVADDDVDRLQVQVWRHTQPSSTNCPKTSEESKSRSKFRHTTSGLVIKVGTGLRVGASLPMSLLSYLIRSTYAVAMASEPGVVSRKETKKFR